MMIPLRKLQIELSSLENPDFPFNVSSVRNLGEFEFTTPCTIFVGENGSGKSTLLEGIAKAVGSISIGSDEISLDRTLDAVAPLADVMKLVWNKRTHRGFFLRAEDFFGFVKRIRALKREMVEELHRIDQDYQGRSDYAKNLAKAPAGGSIQSLEAHYGEDLDAQSHGESFLSLLQSRFVPGGLYLLDEPEAALSPLSQLGLISMIKAMMKEDAQFIIATHSPIIMAISEAFILDFDQNPPVLTAYDELAHVQMYRDFLKDPKAFIYRL